MYSMEQKISQQMCSNYTLYAAIQTDFYLRQNELTAIVIPEVYKWKQKIAIAFFVNVKEKCTKKLPRRWMTNESLWLQR